MSEANEIETTGGVKSAPATGWLAAKRTDNQMTGEASAPPLAGRKQPIEWPPRFLTWGDIICSRILESAWAAGERSGPANERSVPTPPEVGSNKQNTTTTGGGRDH